MHAHCDGPRMSTEFELQSTLAGLPAVNPATEPGGSDIALVQAAQSGDRSAFGMLYARYARMVHAILLSKVPYAAVEDLVQDVFLRALPRLNSLRDVSRFGGWLAAIARNRATDFHRQSRPADEFDEQIHEGDKQPHPAIRVDQSEAHQVLEAIRSLPDTYRETLILRLVEGMTGPEIAARTGLTHGSVRVNLHRGMQQLRELLSHKTGASDSQASSTPS
jgi:RNA polymerase sigma-70 factor, ECF subfamily